MDHMYNGIELFRLIDNNQILEKINMFHYNRNDISSVDWIFINMYYN